MQFEHKVYLQNRWSHGAGCDCRLKLILPFLIQIIFNAIILHTIDSFFPKRSINEHVFDELIIMNVDKPLKLFNIWFIIIIIIILLDCCNQIKFKKNLFHNLQCCIVLPHSKISYRIINHVYTVRRKMMTRRCIGKRLHENEKLKTYSDNVHSPQSALYR